MRLVPDSPNNNNNDNNTSNTGEGLPLKAAEEVTPWLRTNGVSTNGAAAEVTSFDRLGEKGTPCHVWEEQWVSGSTQKVPLSKHMKLAVIPLVLTPFVPFRMSTHSQIDKQINK